MPAYEIDIDDKKCAGGQEDRREEPHYRNGRKKRQSLGSAVNYAKACVYEAMSQRIDKYEDHEPRQSERK